MRSFLAMLPAELGGDHNLSLEGFQSFAYQFLIRERTVYFRRIEEGDTAFDSLVQEIDHFLFVSRFITKAHAHAAQTNG